MTSSTVFFIVASIILGIIIALTVITCKMASASLLKQNGDTSKICPPSKLKREYDRHCDEALNLLCVSAFYDELRSSCSSSTLSRYHRLLRELITCKFNFENTMLMENNSHDFLVLSDKPTELIEKFSSELKADFSKELDKCGCSSFPELYFGCYQTSSYGISFQNAVKRAKVAAWHAKKNGLGFCVWEYPIEQSFNNAKKREDSIKEDIRDNRFYLMFQPVIDLKSRKIVACEALSRLNSDDSGIIKPSGFLEAVSSTGMNPDFDYYIFEKTCKFSARRLRAHKDIRFVSSNFSRVTISEPDFPERILDIINRYGLDCGNVAVEVLEHESAPSGTSSQMKSNLIRLQNNGVKILLDDFGDGYTSYRDIENFPVNFVKIDKHFIHNADNPKGRIILSSIATLAKKIGVKVICEGIENENNLKIATELDCDLVQGYYFHPPISAEDFEKLLSQNDKA